MSVIRLLNVGMQQQREHRRRVWVATGTAMSLGEVATIRVYADCQGGIYRAYAVVTTFLGARYPTNTVMPLEGAAWLDLARCCGLFAIARAIEFDRHDRPTRVLIEFVDVHQEFNWGTPA